MIFKVYGDTYIPYFSLHDFVILYLDFRKNAIPDLS